MTTPCLRGRCGAPIARGVASCAYCNVSFEGAPPARPPSADPAVVESRRRGSELEAIRSYRLATKSSLASAKDALDAFERTLGPGA